MSFTEDHLMAGEKLITLEHPHLMVLARAILVNVAFLALLVALSLALSRAWLLAFQLVPLAYLAWEVVVRQSREYILTDHRVVKQEGVFAVNSFDASLDKINNVFHEQTLLGRLVGYGDVGLETASEQGTTLFSRIPDPVAFKNSIVRQREVYKSMQGRPGTQGTREDIPRLIQDLASLRDRQIISEAEFEEKKRGLLARL